jgi:hypothetical protein
MELRLSLEGEGLGPWTQMKMDKLGGVVREAMREAAQETADFILFRTQEDIEEAGNFGDKWTEMINADISETQRTIRLDVTIDPEGPPQVYWPVFEYSAHIEAKNPSGYMWLPFIGVDRAAAGIDVWPRVYSGNLFRATSKSGTPLLGDVDAAKAGDMPWRYFGVESVDIPKKFHLHEIIKEEAEKARIAFHRLVSEAITNG